MSPSDSLRSSELQLIMSHSWFSALLSLGPRRKEGLKPAVKPHGTGCGHCYAHKNYVEASVRAYSLEVQ